MEVLKKIVEESGCYDPERMINKFSDRHHNTYVLTWLNSRDNDPVNRVGRVQQVRLESGCWGSDQVFLRHCDGKLMVHENQSFYEVPSKYKEELDLLYQDLPLEDAGEYTIKDHSPETGFIIASKVKDGESTPMRDIKEALKGSIRNLMEKQETSCQQSQQ